jgi:hypothetical protein
MGMSCKPFQILFLKDQEEKHYSHFFLPIQTYHPPFLLLPQEILFVSHLELSSMDPTLSGSLRRTTGASSSPKKSLKRMAQWRITEGLSG